MFRDKRQLSPRCARRLSGRTRVAAACRADRSFTSAARSARGRGWRLRWGWRQRQAFRV